MSSENIMWGFVAKAFTAVRINMVHHTRNVSLGIRVHAGSLGNEATDEFVVFLCRPFLERGIGVTIEHMRTPPVLYVKLQCGRVGELAAVVCEQEGHNVLKGFQSQIVAKGVQDINDRARVVCIPDKGQHKLALNKMNGQQDFAPNFANDAVHFRNREIRVCVPESPEVLIIAANPASFVHFVLLFNLSGSVSHLAGEIQVPGSEKIVVNVSVEGTLAEHD